MKRYSTVNALSPLQCVLVCSLLGVPAMGQEAQAATDAWIRITAAQGAAPGHEHHHAPQAAPAQAQAQPQAQPQRRRGGTPLLLENAEGAEVRYWLPDLSTRAVEPQQGRIELPKTGVDNYHVLVAERSQGQLKQAAIRYEYRRGKPSPESPTRLTEAQKTDFEIVPDPIPREHHRYMTEAQWAFIVRFKGAPLAAVRTTLETSHGSRVVGMTDAAGRVRFTLPDDFPEVKPGRDNNPPAELHVRAEHHSGDIHYQTDLSAPYYTGAHHWESTLQAVAMAGMGFLAGGLISVAGRRNGGKNK